MREHTQTSAIPISPNEEGQSTSFQEVFPANRFHKRGNGGEPTTNATCGPKCIELFEKSDRAGSWAKTFSALLIGMEGWFSNRCALIWKLKTTKYNRLYCQLAVSGRRIEDTGHGLLPTVLTQGIKQCKKGKTVFMPSQLLPTPAAFDRKTCRQVVTKASITRPSGQTFSAGLRMMAPNGLLPTPSTCCKKTDTTKDMKNGTPQTEPNHLASRTVGISSQLNPLYVEEMMGYPPC